MREKEERVDPDKFRLNQGKPALAGDAKEIVGWSYDGLSILDPESPACLAKEEKQLQTGTVRYFVKYNAVTGTMVDPDDDTNLARRGDWTANGRFPFRPVQKGAYDFYVRFLKTKNQAYLRQAGREAEA